MKLPARASWCPPRCVLALLLASAVLALGCGRAAPNSSATAAATAPAAPAAPPSLQAAASQEVRAGIEKQTSQLRGLAFRQPVDYRLMPRRDFKQFLLAKVGEQFTPQELRDYGRALAALGAIPADTDLLAVMLSLYDEQVAAFYVPEQRALYSFAESTWSGGLDRMLLAHELTHALQDQTYDLTKMPLKEKHNDDLAMAAAALLEGDATMLMTRYYALNADRSKILEDLGAMMNQQSAKLQAAPLFLRESLLFPYVQGQQFVQVIHEHRGLKGLDAAFRQPPTSTAEILHPELFLQANRPGPATPQPPAFDRTGWKLIANNVLGEFGIRTLLLQEAGAFRAQVAAAGWNGDRYQAYAEAASTNGPVTVLWVTAWDSPEDATEFEDAFREFAQKRRLSASLSRQGKEVTVSINAAR